MGYVHPERILESNLKVTLFTAYAISFSEIYCISHILSDLIQKDFDNKVIRPHGRPLYQVKLMQAV